ncbi:MAG TPA: cytochrome c oxidase subunit II [Bacteroidia bacterium]|jgi:cytochrome c oxidase subunit 2|nr:cytochrome c oxidase subunit II [Bacteroidia bacterium]
MHYLVYIVLILAAAAIWQLVRVVELSAKLKGIDPNKVTERDNRFNGRMMMAFYFALMAFCIWNYEVYKDKLLPPSGSAHGVEIDWLLNFNFLIIIIVFIITNFALFYMGWKYYGRDGQKATYYTHNNRLEMLWTGVPAVVLFIIIFLGIRLWNNTMDAPPKGTRVIELYAQQFNWKARYSGADNELGKANYLLITGTNDLGLDSTDHNGYDDVIVNDTLFLPVNEEVDFHIRSRDVIHSAYFPDFRAQMNAVPGMETYFHFKPIKTTAEMRKDPYVINLIADVNRVRKQWNEDHQAEINSGQATKRDPIQFDYLLMCNKICGASHWNMQLLVVVGTKDEYNAFMKRHKAFFDGKTAPMMAQVTK